MHSIHAATQCRVIGYVVENRKGCLGENYTPEYLRIPFVDAENRKGLSDEILNYAPEYHNILLVV